jgi:hypothetical protein
MRDLPPAVAFRSGREFSAGSHPDIELVNQTVAAE